MWLVVFYNSQRPAGIADGFYLHTFIHGISFSEEAVTDDVHVSFELGVIKPEF